MRIRDPGWKKFGCGIRDKHPGSETLMDSLHVTCIRIDSYDAFMDRVTEDILSLPGDNSSCLHLLILRDPNLPGKYRHISPIVDLSIAED
jgi:hypothetical protein